MKTYYVYILTNQNNKVLYIGVTNNLQRREFMSTKMVCWKDLQKSITVKS
ncbi:MAG: GIY-YIG nuclease family protein [Melioribacteraceae bacterium]|nr:GIY-YIG nuclease family protein [Melioribacteraceae bacterium]